MHVYYASLRRTFEKWKRRETIYGHTATFIGLRSFTASLCYPSVVGFLVYYQPLSLLAEEQLRSRLPQDTVGTLTHEHISIWMDYAKAKSAAHLPEPKSSESGVKLRDLLSRTASSPEHEWPRITSQESKFNLTTGYVHQTKYWL